MYNILYVDDEPDLLELGTEFLESDGTFAVDTFPSACEALDRLQTTRYDAIVSDYKMPDMDGIAFLTTLRAGGNTTPFIIFTGKGQEDVVIEALNNGADSYLKKDDKTQSRFAELAYWIRHAISQKRDDQVLKESEEKYRFLIENSYDIIYTITREGVFSFISPSWTLILGHPMAEVEGKSYRIFVHPEDVPLCCELLQRSLLVGNKPQDIEYRIRHVDGSWRWHLSQSVPLYDDAGSLIGFEGVARDITERKAAEEALQQANRKLCLLSGIARHDINNQLLVLTGYLTLLEKKQPDASFGRYYRKIHAAAERISEVIQFTSEYEKIGITAPTWQDVRKLVDSAAIQAPLGTIHVINDLPAGMEVFADSLIARLFYNLMDNAARHGGTITMIRFSAEERDGDRIIICEDDGEGVPAADKTKIFERGFGKNTGLGLTISREILSITGITIVENGEPGAGARFEMTVPGHGCRLAGVKNS